MLNRKTILQLLVELNDLAREDNVLLEVDIYGGSAFLLAYDSRAITKDVDAIVRPESIAKRYVQKLAAKHDLPEDWLNSSVSQFLSPKSVSLRKPKREYANFSNLKVRVPTAKYLLALKAMACREPLGPNSGDYADLIFLFKKMEIRSIIEIQNAIDEFFPDDPITIERESILKSLIQKAHEDRVNIPKAENRSRSRRL